MTTITHSTSARRSSRESKWPARGGLGLGTSDPMRLVQLVKAGFPYSTLVRFQKATSLSWEKIADFVQIPSRTIARRQSQGRLRPDESDRVLRASSVFEKTVDLFEGNVEAATHWLQAPQRAFGGETPLDLASTEIGARQVEDLIGRLEHGVFT